MKKQSVLPAIMRWLRSTEMFYRPEREIPGLWRLFEFYTETAGTLINVKENRLKEEKSFWEMEFSGNGEFSQRCNLPPEIPGVILSGRWNRSKNYLTLLDPDEFNKIQTFQFAIDNNILKLLRKDRMGQIEIFGFFRRVEECV